MTCARTRDSPRCSAEWAFRDPTLPKVESLYDLILFSESLLFIPLEEAFTKAGDGRPWLSAPVEASGNRGRLGYY